MELKNRIAIITMHRVINYGSVLQAVALNEFLRGNEYNPIVIDYLFPNEYHRSVALKGAAQEQHRSKLRSHLNGLCQRILRPDHIKKIESFKNFLKKNLVLSHSYRTEAELIENPIYADVYITGSDQVWNPKWIGNDLAFYLSWVPKSSHSIKISYGSSFGQKALDKQYLDYISPWLKEYKFVSVREENNILPQIGVEGSIVLDPTFLIDKQSWKKFIKREPIISGKYILCYIIGYSFNPFPYADEVIKKIKRATGYKVVMIAAEPINMLRGYKVLNDCTPEEFLNLFYNASYVITSSFHGTAFAINFGIPFTSIVDNLSDNDNRQKSLINMVGMGSRGVLRKDEDLTCFTPMKTSESQAPLLEKCRQSSQRFLLDSLKLINQKNEN